MSVKSALSSTTFISGVVGAVFLSPMVGKAAEPGPIGPRPSPSGFQVQLSPFAGTFSSMSLYGFGASLAVPVGSQFELKFDGTLGSWDGDVFGIGAAHFFWRDPSSAMLGVYASYTAWDRFGGVHAYHIGGEGALYFGRWTVEARAGVETGSSTSGVVGPFLDTFSVKTGFFDMVDLAYYLQDNARVSVGHRFFGGRHAAALAAEVGFNFGGGTMGSLFVEGRIGENDYQGIWGGLRFYFGRHDKTLVQRHRSNDAATRNLDQLQSFRHQRSLATSPPPPPPPPDGYE